MKYTTSGLYGNTYSIVLKKHAGNRYFFVRAEKIFCTRSKSFWVVTQIFFLHEEMSFFSSFTLFTFPIFTTSHYKDCETESYKKNKHLNLRVPHKLRTSFSDYSLYNILLLSESPTDNKQKQHLRLTYQNIT